MSTPVVASVPQDQYPNFRTMDFRGARQRLANSYPSISQRLFVNRFFSLAIYPFARVVRLCGVGAQRPLGWRGLSRPIERFARSEPRPKLRSDLIHRRGVGISLGKAGVRPCPKRCLLRLFCGGGR